MSKIHVLKERSGENIGDHAELRGLDDPAIFRESGLRVHLLVRNLPDFVGLAGLSDAYDLKFERDPSACYTHFETRNQVCGEHKAQALRLFFAGLELARNCPVSSALLMQTSGLREVIARRKLSTYALKEASSILKAWVGAGYRLSIDRGICAYLQSAGVILDPPLELLHFGDEALGALHERMLGGTEARKEAG